MQSGTHLRRIFFINMILRTSSSFGAVVTVHGSARLTCNDPCSAELKCVYAKGSEILVTQCKQGSCLEGDAFKDRTKLTVSEHGLYLHLNKVEYNDAGMYIFYCGNSVLCRKTLDVLAPVPMNTAVGENVSIPFYAHTSKSISDRDIVYRCEKDGELVVELQRGKMSYGPGFQGRVSISVDSYRKGDLSLSIASVLQSDRGTYHCTHRHQEPVHPEAVTLSVTVGSTTLEAKKTWPTWRSFLCTVGVLSLLVVRYLLYIKCLWC